jgi:transposase InsO family protein
MRRFTIVAFAFLPRLAGPPRRHRRSLPPRFSRMLLIRNRDRHRLPARGHCLLMPTAAPHSPPATDDGSCYRSRQFRQACAQLGIHPALPVPTPRAPMAKPNASSKPLSN